MRTHLFTTCLLLLIFSFPANGQAGLGFTLSQELAEGSPTNLPKTPSAFNVLDRAVWDPQTSHLKLIGHQDPQYSISRIPYQQYFPTILETPNLAVTLVWTEESKKAVRAWIKNLDSSRYLENLTRQLFQLFDEQGRIPKNRRWLARVLGLMPEARHVESLQASDLRNPGQSPTRLEVLQAVFDQVEKRDAGKILEGLFLFHASDNPSSQTHALIRMLAGIRNDRLFRKVKRDAEKGRKPPKRTLRKVYPQLLDFMEQAFGLRENTLLQVYSLALQRENNPSKAFKKALLLFRDLLPKILQQDLQKIFGRYQEIQVPPEVLVASTGIQPQMKLIYIGAKPENPLADLMFRADYLCKQLPHQPQLQKLIPGYQTEFSFYRDHPQVQDILEKKGVQRRMWVFPDRTILDPEKDANSLELPAVKMSFHIQVLEGNREILLVQAGYDELLTSLYESLAQHFPVLHELREAAKLAVLGRWYQSLPQAGNVPQKGLEFFQGPKTIPGSLYLSWAPQFRNGITNLRWTAEGGIWLGLPPEENFFHPTGTFSFAKDLSSSHRKFLRTSLQTLAKDLLKVKLSEEQKLNLYSVHP